MNSKDMFLAALDGEHLARSPVMYQHLGGAQHLMERTGLGLREAFSDPLKFARLSLASHKVFRYDNVMAGWGDLLMEASAFGADLHFSSDERYPKEVPIPLEEVDSLEPVDPLSHPQWSVPLRAATMMNDAIGKEVPVLGGMSSPFIVAASVIGYENLLIAQMVQPDLAHKLLRTISTSQNMQVEYLAAVSGIDVIFISDALADADQNIRGLCQEFDLNYTGIVIKATHGEGMKVIVHNCSESPYAQEEMETYRPEAMHLSVKWQGYSDVREHLGGACIVAGIDHRALIYSGTPDEIMAEVARVRSSHCDDHGSILAPACELPFDTPLDNILALREAAGKAL